MESHQTPQSQFYPIIISVKEGSYTLRCSPSFLSQLSLSAPEVYEAIVTSTNKGDFVETVFPVKYLGKNAQPGWKAPIYLRVLEEEEENDFTENEPKETQECRNNLTYLFLSPGSINL